MLSYEFNLNNAASYKQHLIKATTTSYYPPATVNMVKVLENRIVDLDILPGTKEEQEAAARAK